MTQTVNLRGGSPRGVGPNAFNQLAPSLAPLGYVFFDTTASGSGDYTLYNNSSTTQTFNVNEITTIVIGVFPLPFDALLDAVSTRTYSVSLGPGQTIGEGAEITGNASATFASTTTDLSQFVGTGQNVISVSIGASITVNNFSITVTGPNGSINDPVSYSGTTTVSYAYGSLFTAVPDLPLSL